MKAFFRKLLTRDAGVRARARDSTSRLCISLSHLCISSSQRCISLSQQRDSCSCTREQLIHEKVVPLSEKSYHFCKSPTTFPPLQLSRHWDSLSRHWDSLSHHSLQLSRQGLTGSVPVSPCKFQAKHIKKSGDSLAPSPPFLNIVILEFSNS